MKNGFQLTTVLLLCLFNAQTAVAQTSFLIKSFSSPGTAYACTYNPGFPGDAENDPIPPSYYCSGTGSGGWPSIRVKTVAPFNCAGTTTNVAQIVIQDGNANDAFIMKSEIIYAAKFGYQLESSEMLYLNPSLGGHNGNTNIPGGGCQVKNVSIKVQ